MSADIILENKKLIALLIIAVLLLYFAPRLLSTASYVTGYEGAKPSFYGVKDLQNGGKTFTNDNYGNASLHEFGTTMLFDEDDATTGLPNIAGEMTSIQIPMSNNTWVPPDWVPSDWWRDSLSWKNPTNVYEWKIRMSDGSYKVYRMEEWKLKWFISLSAEWDSTGWLDDEESNNKFYKNVEIWAKIDLRPVWYFQGQDVAYFAIGKIELANIKTDGMNGDPRITPMSPGSTLEIYLNPFGSDTAPKSDDFKAYYYQNTTLNPDLFRDYVYVKITLNEFGVHQWWDWFTLKQKGDSAVLGFNVYVFVVGVWTVKDIQDIQDYQGRSSKIQTEGFSIDWSWLTSIFSSPWTWFGIGSFLLILILGIVAIVLLWFFGIPAFLKRRG
jgi:hypothetical protein